LTGLAPSDESQRGFITTYEADRVAAQIKRMIHHERWAVKQKDGSMRAGRSGRADFLIPVQGGKPTWLFPVDPRPVQ